MNRKKERLQKIIARSGIASRRKAEELILEGRVSVNGAIAAEPGTKADAGRDEIRVDGKLISAEATLVYLMLNKPSGYVTSLSDPQGRPVVMDLLTGMQEHLFPVGRLDYDSEGLLLLTNDGDFANMIQHPSFGMEKTYSVKVKGRIRRSVLSRMRKGALLSDGFFCPLNIDIERQNEKSCWLDISIHEGRNRIIRRFFEEMGFTVARLKRNAIDGLTLGDLGEGSYRYLTDREVRMLRRKAEVVKS